MNIKILPVFIGFDTSVGTTFVERVQMAEQLLKAGFIKTPDDYLTVMDTGKLEIVPNITTLSENTQKSIYWTFDETGKSISAKDNPSKCSCDVSLLMTSGCRCGGI